MSGRVCYTPADRGVLCPGLLAATAGGEPGQPTEYHFICECFFMTLKSLHLGLAKMVDDFRVESMVS